MNFFLEHNKKFVENREYEKYITDKFPEKKTAIVACMDTRMTELLPAALGIKNGDTKIIKTAGATISHPFGSIVRSLLIAIYELGVKDILIIGHTDCGVQYVNSEKMISYMLSRGIPKENIDRVKYYGVNFETWLSGFGSAESSVRESVVMLKDHPLIPDDITIRGFVMDAVTGELTSVE